jgi:hypothetical protein
MSAFEDAINRARDAAIEKDRDRVIGVINGAWVDAEWDDNDLVSRMDAPTLLVTASGLRAWDVVDAFERIGIRGEYDEGADVTRFDLPFDAIYVGGNIVEVNRRILLT